MVVHIPLLVYIIPTESMDPLIPLIVCNQYASDPPVVVDEQGNFYGYLTVNPYYPKAIKSESIRDWLKGVCK